MAWQGWSDSAQEFEHLVVAPLAKSARMERNGTDQVSALLGGCDQDRSQIGSQGTC